MTIRLAGLLPPGTGMIVISTGNMFHMRPKAAAGRHGSVGGGPLSQHVDRDAVATLQPPPSTAHDAVLRLAIRTTIFRTTIACHCGPPWQHLRDRHMTSPMLRHNAAVCAPT